MYNKYKDLFDYPYDYLHENIGIYKITFKESDKVYIGSALATKSNSKDERGFYARWKSHIYSLRKGNGCPILQKAYNKYGEKSINFEILDIFKKGHCKEYYNIIESGYIAKYEAQTKGYNVLPKGGSKLNSKVSNITKEKISLKNKGKNNANYGLIGKNHMSSKPVFQYSINGEFIQKWDSKADVERKLGIESPNIHRACKRDLTAGGFKWKNELIEKGEKANFSFNV